MTELDSPSTPLLSILIPAYHYAEGVQRILAQLTFHEDLEIIVFDDSLNDHVESAVTTWSKVTGLNVSYKRNRPALGAVSNWNALLEAAHGDYCLLLHHDEFPVGICFVQDIVTTLRRYPDTDIAVLDCVLVAPSGRNRRHLPAILRSLVLNHFPQYLYRRNVIGPTAALVIRRSMYPRFDVQLQWLVDVDVYVRLLNSSKYLRMCPHIQIGSLLGRADSITAGLGSSINKVGESERAYLLNSRTTDTLWLKPTANLSFSHKLLGTFETLCWWSLRICTRTIARLYPCPISPAKLQRILYPQQGG